VPNITFDNEMLLAVWGFGDMGFLRDLSMSEMCIDLFKNGASSVLNIETASAGFSLSTANHKSPRVPAADGENKLPDLLTTSSSRATARGVSNKADVVKFLQNLLSSSGIPGVAIIS